MEKLEKNNIRRKKLTKIYNERFVDIYGLKVPFDNCFGLSSNHIFPILLDRNVSRSGFMNFMKEKGVQSSIHYPAIHLFDFYRRNFGYNNGFLPVTEEVAQREVTLPLYPSMKDEDVHYICDSIVECMERRNWR